MAVAWWGSGAGGGKAFQEHCTFLPEPQQSNKRGLVAIIRGEGTTCFARIFLSIVPKMRRIALNTTTIMPMQVWLYKVRWHSRHSSSLPAHWIELKSRNASSARPKSMPSLITLGGVLVVKIAKRVAERSDDIQLTVVLILS